MILSTPDGPALGIVVAWCGDLQDGEAALQPLRDFQNPVMDTIAPVPYEYLQGLLESMGYVAGHLNYWKSNFVNELSDELIDRMVDLYPSTPSDRNMIVLEHMGGAIKRVAVEDTAFSHRESEYAHLILRFWDDPAETDRNIAWVRDVSTQVEPMVAPGIYVNYLADDETTSRVEQAYGANFARLSEIKRKYDPGNLFRHNQNIRV